MQPQFSDNSSSTTPLVDRPTRRQTRDTTGGTSWWGSAKSSGEGRRYTVPEVYRGRHLKCAPIADFVVSSQRQSSRRVCRKKMSYPRSVTVPLLLAILARVQAVTLFNAPSCPNPYGIHAYAHPEDCGAFFLCTNGTLSYEYCENGLLFDGHGSIHNHCNYNWAVDCGNRKVDYTPISSPGCEYQFGMYPDSDSCSTNYIKCIYGEPHPTQCDSGLVYNAKTHTCVWPDELIPFCNPEAIVGFKCPHKLPPNSPAAKFWPYPRFPVPGDCGRLITCVDGHPRLLTCGDGKLFDSVSLTCLDPDDVPHCTNGV